MGFARWASGILAVVALWGAAPAAFAAEIEAEPTTEPAPGVFTAAGLMQLIGGRMNRGGYEVKFITNDRYEGVLYGVRGVRYLLPELYVGLMGYGTLPAIGQELAPAFGTLGLLTGYEGRLPYRLTYDVNLHAGITRSLSDCSPSPLRDHLSLEPSVSVGVPVPFLTGTRLSLCLGYVALPFAYEFSGPTFGLRWETKSVSRTVAD